MVTILLLCVATGSMFLIKAPKVAWVGFCTLWGIFVLGQKNRPVSILADGHNPAAECDQFGMLPAWAVELLTSWDVAIVSGRRNVTSSLEGSADPGAWRPNHLLVVDESSTITFTENHHCNDCRTWIKVANPLQVHLCTLNNRRVFCRCSNHLKHFNKRNTTWEPLPLINCLRKHITWALFKTLLTFDDTDW